MFIQPPFPVAVIQKPLMVPPSAVATDVQIPVKLPQSWLPYIATCCAAMEQPAFWAGDDAARINAIEQAAELVDRIGTATLEATRPFFDTAENVDDESANTGELWYEPIGDWIISAFLATTVTPGAAIVYKLTIPKLRLAFRANNVGSAFKILLNGLEVVTGDSYSPIEQVIDVVVDAAGFAAEHGLGSAPWTLSVVKAA